MLSDETVPVESAESVPVDESAPLSPELRVEALLFTSQTPLAPPRLAELAGLARGEVLEAIDHLNLAYAETGRSFRIASVALGFQLVTTPELAPILSKLHAEKIPTRLSRAALETLAIIAFKQPVARAEIDAIRGVSASDRVLRHLLERKAIRIAGRAEAPGRPLLYGTTREFLEYFGLASLTDLPRTEELEALLAGDRPALVDAEDEDSSGELVGGEEPVVAVRDELVHEDDEDDEDVEQDVEEEVEEEA
jgi:segregation and condensation protein B